LTFTQLSNKYSALIEREDSSPCLQKPNVWFYVIQFKSSQRLCILFLWTHFNIIFLSTRGCPK